MAESCEGSSKQPEKVNKPEDYDPRLDFFSDKFDPLLALNTPGLKVPDNTAKKYDNLAMYKSAEEKRERDIRVALDAGEDPTEKWQEQKKKDDEQLRKAAISQPVRREWKEHQLPVSRPHVKKQNDIFKRMDEIKGPLALLKKCKDEKLRIKIWTRNDRFVRGYCVAYLLAFDKHWNMALEDVTEFWTRSKKRKVPAAIEHVTDTARIIRRVKPPPVDVFPHEKNKKLENCLRHVDQLMIRGEHVVFVNVIGPEDFEKTMSIFTDKRKKKQELLRKI